jgi:hypothetical protein
MVRSLLLGALADSKPLQYTVAPAVTAAVVLIILSYSSDYFRERGFHMTIPLGFSIIGYSVLLGIDIETQRNAAYGAIFFCTMGVSLARQRSRSVSLILSRHIR